MDRKTDNQPRTGLRRFFGAWRSEAAKQVVFPPDFLASLERLRLAALKAMGGGLRAGHRLGAYKGGQLEFHGHRNYTPGDELRYLDWNTYARLGRPYIKEFAREEAGIVYLFLDATASMRLGSGQKWTFARRVAALFAHVALSSQDSAYVVPFHGGGAELFPRRGTQNAIRQYLSFLERLETAAELPVASPRAEALTICLQEFLRRRPARGRAIIISDFWMEESTLLAGIGKLCSSGFDVAGIHTLAPEELDCGVNCSLRVRSLEELGEIELSEDASLPARYTHELEKHRAIVESAFRRRGGSYLFAPSNTSIERVLIGLLRQQRWLA